MQAAIKGFSWVPPVKCEKVDSCYFCSLVLISESSQNLQDPLEQLNTNNEQAFTISFSEPPETLSNIRLKPFMTTNIF